MQTANGTLKINDGTEFPVTGITPAEALLLNATFKTKNGGIKDLVFVEDKQVSAEDEVTRLAGKYAKGIARKMFPGATPTLPATFAEVKVVCKDCPAVVKPTKPTFDKA